MSGWLIAAIAVVAGIPALVSLVTVVRSGKPLRFLLATFAEGVCAIAAVNVAGIFTGISLGFNWLTLTGSAVFGVPWVITLLILRLIAV